MKKTLLTAALLLATTAQAADFSIEVTIPDIKSSEYHRPYVAVWVEDSDKKLVEHLSLWYFTKLKDGSYALMIEAVREEGGIEAVSIPFTLPVKEKTEAKASGKSELGEITLTITP